MISEHTKYSSVFILQFPNLQSSYSARYWHTIKSIQYHHTRIFVTDIPEPSSSYHQLLELLIDTCHHVNNWIRLLFTRFVQRPSRATSEKKFHRTMSLSQTQSLPQSDVAPPKVEEPRLSLFLESE